MTPIGIVVRRAEDNRRLSGRIIRKSQGDITPVWTVDEPNRPRRVLAWNPHVTLHVSGQKHSKSYNRASVVRQTQVPNSQFEGRENLKVKNADRMLSPSLPPVVEAFDDTSKVWADCVRETMMLSVDIISVPGCGPVDHNEPY
jgi:hypothetical protein